MFFILVASRSSIVLGFKKGVFHRVFESWVANMIEVGSGPDIFQNHSIHQFRHDFISVVVVLLHHCGPTKAFSNIQSCYAIWTECRHGICVCCTKWHIFGLSAASPRWIERHHTLLVGGCDLYVHYQHTHTPLYF
jgi:hypothetical protein